jgi:anti-sigma regulatory factor (Ser/Thr protein kinase)
MTPVNNPDNRAWEFRIAFQATPRTLRILRKVVKCTAQELGASEAAAVDIELAVGEVGSNAYEHAYGCGVGPLEVDIAFDGQRFTVEVRNHGKSIFPPAVPEQMPQGLRGRGLYIVDKLMDRVEVVNPIHDGWGTAVRMMKRLA